MKLLISLFTLLTLSTAGAASSSAIDLDKTNQVALEILLKNSGVFRSQEGKRISDVLSKQLVTDNDNHHKISNNCSYDKVDELFKCTLIIANTDDAIEERTESSTAIRYELERAQNGLPSDVLFSLTAIVDQAG